MCIYLHLFYIHSAHSKLQEKIDRLPLIGSEEAVMDILDSEEQTADPDVTEHSEHSIFPLPDGVRVESDLINQPASITYHENLMKLVSFLQLPIGKCNYSDRSTGQDCEGIPPFRVSLRSRGTAVSLEWVSM